MLFTNLTTVLHLIRLDTAHVTGCKAQLSYKNQGTHQLTAARHCSHRSTVTHRCLQRTNDCRSALFASNAHRCSQQTTAPRCSHQPTIARRCSQQTNNYCSALFASTAHRCSHRPLFATNDRSSLFASTNRARRCSHRSTVTRRCSQ